MAMHATPKFRDVQSLGMSKKLGMSLKLKPGLFAMVGLSLNQPPEFWGCPNSYGHFYITHGGGGKLSGNLGAYDGHG